MTKFETFKLIHVLAAIVWAGGAAVSQVFAVRLKNAEPAHRLGFAQDMKLVGQRVFLPAALVAFVSGTLMVEDLDIFDYDQTWILLGIGGLLLAAILGGGFLIPQIRKAIGLMEEGRGPEAGAVIGKVTIGSRLVVVILFVVVWAMIAKPGL